MNRRGNILLPILATMTLTFIAASPAPADNPPVNFKALLQQVLVAELRWDYAEADRLSQQALDLAASPGSTDYDRGQAHQSRGSYYFYRGDYQACLAELEKARALAAPGDEEPALYERSQQLVAEWKGAKEARSDHFIIRYRPGPDEVLIEPAKDTLERAYAVLTADFNVTPGDPVLVEFYPSFAGFSSATHLAMEDLENSGTIAVCKYRRLMINTPRNLFYGYEYRDTLSHELVHFVVYQRYAEAVPIWLHEGLAKYEEERWRKDQGGELSPTMQSLLASALKENTLITFDRMSPSFAYLKTPAQGQLAFAEVNCMVKFLLARGGWDTIFKLCDELAKNNDYRAALKKVTGSPFERVWNDYVAFLRQQGFKEIPGMEITALEIRKGEEGFDSVDEEVEEKDLEQGEVWRYIRLGDLLRDRKHYDAALVEYRRARELAPYSARLLNKIGLCALLAGQYDSGIEPLQAALELYPQHVNTEINLARIYFAKDNLDEAQKLFLAALDINPFNPIPYNGLIEIARRRDDRAGMTKYQHDLDLISGRGVEDAREPDETK
jgi:tetratricopeptide (TPR) repeat protein